MHKSALKGALYRILLTFQYGWNPPNLLSLWEPVANILRLNMLKAVPELSLCFCSIQFCSMQNITAQLMEEVCFDVDIEPSLQPISYEVLHYKTANTDDGARFDIAASNFSGKDRQ